MYFKSLELYGFKSFAGKTKIDFEPGITAIVGPNGCGKSNVVDGIKWVLGEQSAKDLRGMNMEDVIFNGTDLKDPVGFAEVSLTLSNESKFLPIEYDEVIITRRLFRSGDSEYLLNKNQVRLKDILELFMGTGVGTNAYSIIEQGKIDMIISSKPEDRRYIFEEASGIIKYKSKKREAVRKLEYTENNLLRVNDIIEEVKRQIGSIERQARKAERYKEEFEKLKTLDTKIAFLEFKRLNEDKQRLEKEILECRNGESQVLSSTTDLDVKLMELKAKLAGVESKLSEAQYRELNLNSNIDRAKDKIELNEERNKELEALKESLLNEQASLQKSISELEVTVASLSQEVEGIVGNKIQKEALLKEREGKFKKLEEEIRTNEQNIRNGKLRLIDILSLHSKTRNDLTKLVSDLANYQARHRRLKIEEESVGKELTSIKEQFTQIEKEVNELVQKIKDGSQSKDTLESESEARKNELGQIDSNILDQQSRQLSLESRLAVLQDMLRRYEGFGAGSKTILLEKRENRLSVPGVCGAIVELISVKKGYEVAVEAAIGEYLQCIVVENRNSALALINYLKQNRFGKATIVSLDSMPSVNEDGPAAAKMDGVLGRLSDFVDTESRFRDLLSVLFRDIYLVKDIEAIAHFNADERRGLKFVALSGEILEGGFFTGGSTKEDAASGLLNRKIQIEEIEGQLVNIKEDLAGLRARKEGLTGEIDSLAERISAQAGLIRQDELVLANKTSRRENSASILKKITDEMSLLNLEIGEVDEEMNSLKVKQTSREAELKRLDEENNGVQTLVSASQSFIDTALKEKEGLLVEVTRMRTELANVSEQERNLSANLKMQEGFLSSQQALIGEKQKNFNDATLRQQELRGEISALQIAIDESAKEREKVSVEFLDVKNNKLELENALGQTGTEFKSRESELNGIKDRMHDCNMKLQENSFKAEALRTRLNQAYKIEIEQLQVEIEEGINLDAVNAEVAELRQKIEKMGPVNLVAIEEHQELKARYDFLTKQQEDLLNAKGSLLEAIRKINKTTRELFMDTFQKVRAEFKEYYRYLFGGGQAELVLMDEQDVLECGIEILARPPGKKLQSISLLSGGEKALTAIALLFSIFKVKPSPFCILDEVDAPLDESNIGRFAKLLTDFTKTSQFIIITHNKKTMSMSDVMYGITMQQSGVSKIVSVKFAKEDKKESAAVTAEK